MVLYVIASRGKLVRVVPAALIDHAKRISYELVHWVVAGTCAHCSCSGHVGLGFLRESGARAVLVLQTVAGLHKYALCELYLLFEMDYQKNQPCLIRFGNSQLIDIFLVRRLF